MADSDDPCDGITPNNLTGWTKRDNYRDEKK